MVVYLRFLQQQMITINITMMNVTHPIDPTVMAIIIAATVRNI